jgi:1-acyl-sn-glycerol-3-phosphate acyltransferase
VSEPATPHEALPGDEFRVFKPDVVWNLVRLFFQQPVERGFQMRIYGRERVPATGPVIVASNHIAGIDVVLVGAASPRNLRYMAKKELFTYNTALTGFLRRAGVFTVRRGESDTDALRQARTILRAGHVLGIFAEGTRQPTEEIGKVMPGAALIALSEGVPIVPCVIQGSIHIKDDLFHPVTVVFGEPLRYPRREGRDGRHQARTVTAELQAELVRLQRFAQSAIRAGRPRRALPPTSIQLEAT